jgi:hypothetical protein
MSTHRMLEQLEACGRSITGLPTTKADKLSMQRLDTQMEEMQHGSEQQCRQLFLTAMPFSEPVQTYHYRRRAYQGLLNVLEQKAHNASNAYRFALRCGIPSPRNTMPGWDQSMRTAPAIIERTIDGASESTSARQLYPRAGVR